MIPLSTPIGTEIVCIDDRPYWTGPLTIRKGVVYTLERWMDHPTMPEAGIVVAEAASLLPSGQPWAFERRRFRLLDKAADISFYNAHVPINLETVTS